jgi:hypothetical protein
VGRIKLSPTNTPGVFRLDGWSISTAANGDLLFAVYSGRLDALTGTVTATVTYFGGTGRFAGAAGTGLLSARLFPDGSIWYAIDGMIDL